MFVTGTNVAWREYLWVRSRIEESLDSLNCCKCWSRDHDKANTHVFLSHFGVKSHGMWSWDPAPQLRQQTAKWENLVGQNTPASTL